MHVSFFRGCSNLSGRAVVQAQVHSPGISIFGAGCLLSGQLGNTRSLSSVTSPSSRHRAALSAACALCVMSYMSRKWWAVRTLTTSCEGRWLVERKLRFSVVTTFA